MFNIINKSITMPDGKIISVETGKMARQADGSVVVRCGDTMLLATVVASHTAKDGVDFLPLSVDYQEKFASAGRIPGSFQRREGRLSDHEVLISRLIDRALRPIFPEDYHADVQVNVILISADAEVLPDALAAFAASAAIAVSDIPFNGPISEVRVAKINGQYVVNPNTSDLATASMDLIVAGTADNIIMVEGEADECLETDMLEAIKIGHDAIRAQVAMLVELGLAVGKNDKRVYSHETHDEEIRAMVSKSTYDAVYAVCKEGNGNKSVRKEKFGAILTEFLSTLVDPTDLQVSLAKKYFHDVEYDALRNMVLDERVRLDGRALNQIRQIQCEIDYLPKAHGSALFTRGETQSLTTATLGTKMDEQIVDQAMSYGYSKFMLHYNFPGFSTGEVKPNRGPGRREIGHGNLAQRSLKKVMPLGEDNPYTIRIVSDILESNGSSSMATVCAGTLAAMDAGIKLKAPVSGIAMGLISDPTTGKFAVLSDILGDEDHLGDMDFKVTGTEKGIVACQMDIKIGGLSFEILEQALSQAKEGRLHILSIMNATISKPRPEFKDHAPRAVTFTIDKEFIGAVIGPGGKIIQEIQRESGAVVNIEEKEGKGFITIFATNGTSLENANRRIRNIVAIPEEGETYKGIVKTIQPFGAFVEFMPSKDGLLHISEISWERLETMDGVFTVGQEIDVKLVEVDKKTGKYRLSRKALLPKPEKK
jgi:polyribonucleotide nucleotidyltransferase